MKSRPAKDAQDNLPDDEPRQPPVKLVVCAAIRKSGHIICGARHYDQIMRSALYLMNEKPIRWEQGFIDQRGNFLTREEAWMVADSAGQIRRRCGGDEGHLYSENLY
jgi:hypothetical protein